MRTCVVRLMAAGPSSGRPLLRDRGLFQLQQNRRLLGERRVDDLPVLVDRLRPWVELDSSKGNTVSSRILGMGPLQLETLGQVVDLLLERRNRVWARVVIEFLGSSLKWAQQLDNEGEPSPPPIAHCHSALWCFMSIPSKPWLV